MNKNLEYIRQKRFRVSNRMDQDTLDSVYVRSLLEVSGLTYKTKCLDTEAVVYDSVGGIWVDEIFTIEMKNSTITDQTKQHLTTLFKDLLVLNIDKFDFFLDWPKYGLTEDVTKKCFIRFDLNNFSIHLFLQNHMKVSSSTSRSTISRPREPLRAILLFQELTKRRSIFTYERQSTTFSVKDAKRLFMITQRHKNVFFVWRNDKNKNFKENFKNMFLRRTTTYDLHFNVIFLTKHIVLQHDETLDLTKNFKKKIQDVSFVNSLNVADNSSGSVRDFNYTDIREWEYAVNENNILVRRKFLNLSSKGKKI